MNAIRNFHTIVLATTLSALDLPAQAIFTNPITGTNPNTSNPFTLGQTVDLNLSASGIGRGNGINGDNATNRYSANGWNSVSLDPNDYFTWTLTPAPGYQLSLVNFVYSGQASSSGPGSFAFRSSHDGFSANLATPAATGAIIALTDALFQSMANSVEFRLYGWNAASGTGTFSVNDFTFNGSASAIPEPSTYAATAGLGALAASFWLRRRRQTKERPHLIKY